MEIKRTGRGALKRLVMVAVLGVALLCTARLGTADTYRVFNDGDPIVSGSSPCAQDTSSCQKGPGSCGTLRDAIVTAPAGGRIVYFPKPSSGGHHITLSCELPIKNQTSIAIDATNLPSSVTGGVIIDGHDISIEKSTYITIRGINFRGSASGEDAITVQASKNVLIEHNSISGYLDDGIDVTNNSHAVTRVLPNE